MGEAMKYFIVAVFLASAVSGYGEDECTWGPSYWCQKLRSAKACNAVAHCMDTIWATDHSYEQDNSDVCEFCENIVGDVRNFLTDNETENAVRDYLDSACGIIPVEELADECKDTVDNDLNELFNLIRSALDPKAVCSTIGLCRGFLDTTLHQSQQQLHMVPLIKSTGQIVMEPRGPSDMCPDCKKLLKDVQEALTDNTTVQEVETVLKEQLCSHMMLLEDQCDSLVETFTPEILQLLASQVVPDEACAALGMCPGGDLLLLVKMKLQKSPLYKALFQAQGTAGEECTFCKLVFEELQELDRDTAVQQEVEDFVNTYLCSKLGDYKDVCESTVQEYGQMIFELLATELDPDTRCKALGFCSEAGHVGTTKMIRDSMPVTNIHNTASQPTKPVKASAGCVICEAVMMELKTMLTNNETEAELLADLEKVCSIMPDTIKESCLDFVETYGPAVVEMLLQELDPEMVCTMLGLCSKVKAVHKVPGDGELCGVCETVIQYLDSVLQENSTQEQIKKDLERICNFLPDTLKEQCDDLVEQYMTLIIQLVAEGLTPEEVCKELGLCSAAQVAVRPFINEVPIVAESAPLVGVNECTYGPSFWCASKENAERCKATAHCQEKVWQK